MQALLDIELVVLQQTLEEVIAGARHADVGQHDDLAGVAAVGADVATCVDVQHGVGPLLFCQQVVRQRRF